MPRATNRLTTKTVAALKTPGMYADGGGLYLRITKALSKQWVFIFQWAGKRSEMGLGGAAALSLAQARDARDAAAQQLRSGQNPITARRAENTPDIPRTGDTFGEVATEVIDGLEAGWKNEKHKAQWRSSLKMYCKPIWSMPVGLIKTEDVKACLTPIWSKLPETADRVRGRLERVLDAAVVMGKRDPDLANPARWKGHLKLILPTRGKIRRKHHSAMPFEELPAFMLDLRSREALAARCLELTVLCCTRSGEAFGAHIREFDMAKEEWTIPAERMKAGAPHTIPLVGRALEIVRELLPLTNGYLFPSPGSKAGHLSNMAMEMLLRRMGVSKYTVHGMRSTFRDWAGDCTEHPEEIAEMALAHTVGSAVRRAYRRSEALTKRRALMVDWDAFAMGAEPEPDKKAA